MKLWQYSDCNPGYSMTLQKNNRKKILTFPQNGFWKKSSSVIISRGLRYYWSNSFKWQNLRLLVSANILYVIAGCEILNKFSESNLFFSLFALKSVTTVLWFLLPAGQYIFHSLTISITSFHLSISHQRAPASAPQNGPSLACFWGNPSERDHYAHAPPSLRLPDMFCWS